MHRPQQVVVSARQGPLTASMLATVPPQEQKQMLGERLFSLVQGMYPDLAGKITGMLLEIDNSELLRMLECRMSLEAKVSEAVAVLQGHQAKEAAAMTKKGNKDMEAKRAILKKSVVEVLKENPHGIKRDHLWNFVAKKMGQSPKAGDYGFGKMSQMFPLLQHLYQEYKVGKDVLIKLKPPGVSEPEVISSDEDDFPSLLSARVGKGKATKSTKGKSSKQGGSQGSFWGSPRPSSSGFLSLDVSASSSRPSQSKADKFAELKDLLVKLLKKKGRIVKTQLWGHFQREYQTTPKGSDYGVSKMADVIENFTDVIEERRIDGENYLLLRSASKPEKQATPRWGQGAAMAPGIGRTSHDRISSSSDDSSDSDCIMDESRTFMNSNPRPPGSVMTAPKPAQATGQPLMVMQSPIPIRPMMMMPQRMMPPQPIQPLLSLRMFQPIGASQNPPQGVHPGIAAAQNMQRQPSASPSSSRSDSQDRSSSTSRERSLSRDRHQSRERPQEHDSQGRKSARLERKEINVAAVPHSRGIPSREHIDNIAKECIAILAESNEHVSLERIEKLLCQRFNKRSIRDFQLRYVEQISSVNEHNRLLCKVNMYIQAFVKSRSACTLYELSECMREFTKDKDDFETLKLGPLQRMPLVYDMFKFPCDEEIPEITTMDILEHVRDYLTKNNKWMERLEMEPMMNYLVDAYNMDTAYQLGIRIRSLPLTVQMLKKSQRDAANTRRTVTEQFKDNFKKDLAAAFKKFQAAVLQSGEDGGSEVRSHYLKLRPEVAIMEIYQKFQLLMSIDQPETKAEMKRHRQMESVINSFLLTLRGDQMACLLFHLAICVGNTTLEESAMELLAPPSPPAQESSSMEDKSAARQPPSKAAVLDNLRKYIERCLAHGSLSLQHLDRIEEKLLEDFTYTSFQTMGFGRFLHFLINDQAAKTLLEEAGGTSFGSSGGSSDSEAVYKPQMTDVLEMVRQCREAGITQNDRIESALRDQFLVSDVKQLGYGNISRLITSADKPGKHKSSEHLVLYEAAIAGTTSQSGHGQGKVGILGHQTRDHALACLHNCPLLEDLAEWSQWSMVFEPQYGKLKDFIQKYGGITNVNIEGGTKKVTTDVIAMETHPGILLKLVSQTSPEKFQTALTSMDVGGTCGHLVSMVIMNKGTENTPTALLANHMKTALFSMHAANQTPGGPPELSLCDPAVLFVLECLVKLPVRICVALANQIFLEPLGQVVGATKSKSLLLSSCRDVHHLHQIEKLGCLLGIQEWTDTFLRKCHPPPDAITEVYSAAEVKELMEQGEEIVESESEEESEEESESESDDLDSILSDEEQVTQTVISEDKMAASQEADVKKEDEETDMTEVKAAEDNEESSSEDADQADQEKKKEEETEEKKTEDEDDEPKMSKCQIVIEQIRREEFGIGVELNEDGQRLMKVQQERLGRSLDRLSKDLYSKDTHFVLELVQNADDNAYPDDILKNEKDLCPSVKFCMDSDGVTVLNNECGFREKDIRALCDVGRSTKGKHKFGYIGQKGIGFKSVFRVTDCPEVHSNGFHLKFDVKSGPTGYILPHWIDAADDVQEGWTTKIYLPLKDEMSLQTRSLAARFNDIHPSLLLFLHRLREINVENLIECSVVTMRRRDLGEGIVEIDHGTKVDRWLVVKKLLDASNISIQAKSGVDVESTEIALAFPLRAKDHKMRNMQVLPSKQPVFAFLPLRSYGFRFIIQGDFDVPSSREDVDRDSPWNQWLRNEIHTLFIETLDIFKSHPDFSNMEALSAYLQFVPMEDEILDFFRPVATQILGKLRAKECLPVQNGKKGAIQLKIPSQTVIVRDQLVKEVISPEVLQKNLNLYYLHNDVAMTLTPSLAQSLGVESITVDHLLQIGKSLILSWDTQSIDTEKVLTVAKWLACVYRSLDEFQENQSVFERLKSTRIIPLSTGQLVSLDEVTVFLPPVDADRQQPQAGHLGRKDPVSELYRDLSMVHAGLLTTSDNEVNSQVQKLLQRVDVKQMSPYDIIHHHILPTLKSDAWQSKPRDILISYLVFIKCQVERQPSLINMAELKSLALVVTNCGIKKPVDEAVHFTKAYGNKIDLQKQLPGYDWILLDAVYLNQAISPHEVQKWHEFFHQLGVTDFLSVTPTEVHLTKESMVDTPWGPLQEMWPPSATGYHFTDFACEEFTALVTRNKQPDLLIPQLCLLFEILDRDWDSKYSKFQTIQVKDGNGQVLRDAESSFCISLTTSKWVPASVLSLVESPDGGLRMQEDISIMQPSLLYMKDLKLQRILSHAVYYLAVKSNPQSSFTKYLRVKNTVETKVVKDLLIEWGKREENDSSTPRTFRSCLAHLKAVYQYLHDSLVPKEYQDLYHHHPVIFVPDSQQQDSNDQILIQGKMLGRNEVWWMDKSGLFHKYQSLLHEYHSDLANKHTICHLYQDMGEIFFHSARIDDGPKLTHFADLLSLMVMVHLPSDKIVLFDTLSIFVRIGSEHIKVDQNQGTLGDLHLLKSDVDAAMKKLKKQKIFPTKKDLWVSVDDNPMIADNRELEKMFADEKDVHFLIVEEPGTGVRRVKQKRAREKQRLDPDSIISFMGLFKIPLLTDCIKTEEITEMSALCPKLQNYAHIIVPYIQCYLYNNYPDVYQKLVSEKNVLTNLKIINFQQVSKLEVIYTLTNNPEPRVIRPEKCIQTGNQFYFHTSHVESYSDINREIAKYFSCSDEECFKFLRIFLSDLRSALDDQENINQLMEKNDMEHLPDDEEFWEVPPPVIPEPIRRPPSRQVSEKSETAAEGEGGIRSWPPQASALGVDVDNMAAKTTKAPERSKDSKMWPPPKPPEYQQQVRDLPANIKVIHRSESTQSDTASVKSEGRETTCARTGDIIIIKSDSGDGTGPQKVTSSDNQEGATGEGVQQPNRDDGGTVKRKLSDSDIAMESKRPTPVGGASSHAPSPSGDAGSSRQNIPSEKNSDQNIPSEKSAEHQGQATPGAKRRHIPSESEVASSPKKPVFFKPGDPSWSESASEMVYEELGTGVNLQIPEPLVVDEQNKVDMTMVGRWGEQLVRDYLLQQSGLLKDIIDIRWVNENEESGLPYDFEIICFGEDGKESRTVYIEVKSTLKDEKKQFEISSNEVNFARTHRELYQIYRIFNVGDPENVKLLRIDNVALKMDQGKLKLFMYI